MWQEKDKALYKEFTFKDFGQAFIFMQAVAAEAERRQHHPRWENQWNKVRIWLSTHSENRVTEKDKSFSEFIDALAVGGTTPIQKPVTTDTAQGQYKEIKLYCDGGSRGNPGPSASGYVFLDMADNVILKAGVYLGITTNNQAEYQALKFGLEHAARLHVRTVHVYMDSLLVINQMKGIFKVRNRDLWPIHEAIKNLLPSFERVVFSHVPRELNKLADGEVNETLDAEAAA